MNALEVFQETQQDMNGTKKERHQYNELLDDIDVEGDPYYLKYYRNFHNHELDTNVIENLGQVADKDLHRKDLIVNNIPMGKAVIQHYSTERRKEIIEEGTVNQFRYPFDAKSNYVTKL